MAMIEPIRATAVSFVSMLTDPSRFVGAVFASLLATAVWAMVSIYWGNGLSLSTFSHDASLIGRETLHTSFAGRVLFFSIQAASWGVLLWPVVLMYRVLAELDEILGVFAIFAMLFSAPLSFYFLKVAGWLMFNDKTIFMREWIVLLSN